MSRKLPLWQPGDRWQPPIVRISGTMPGSLEEQLLLARYGGALRQFYLGSRRAHTLGIVNQTGAHREFRDGRMHYTNVMGQEIVELQIRPELIPRPEPKKPTKPWDWALIDLEFEAAGTGGYFGAFVVNPLLEPIIPTSRLPIKGVAKEFGSWAGGSAHIPNPVVAYPDYGVAGYAGSVSSTQISSLRVDLRPFRGMSHVVVDIYGAVDATYTETPTLMDSQLMCEEDRRIWDASVPAPDVAAPLRIYGDFTFAAIVELFPELSAYEGNWYVWDSVAPPDQPISYPDVNVDGVQDLNSYWASPGTSLVDPIEWASGSWTSPTPTEWLTAFPYEEETTYWGTGVLKTHRLLAVRFIIDDDPYDNVHPPTPPPVVHSTPNPYPFRTTGSDYKKYYQPVYEPIEETIYSPRLATIKGACFQGDVWDTWTMDQTDYLNFRVWQNSRTYPQRPNLPVIEQGVSITALDFLFSGSPYNHFNTLKLGTLSIDLVFGAVGFTPA